MDAEQAQQFVQELESEKRDLILYSGEISDHNFHSLIGIVLRARATDLNNENLSIVLTTYGGDAHYAYRIAKILQGLYGKFRLVVLGPCKSAGTLVAVGANELAMSPLGELGPLDVQLAKRDEIAVTTSGLDTLGALAMLQSKAFDAFERYMVTIVQRSSYTVSTKTACDIAATLVTGLFQPIASQVDPHRLSEVDRRMKIAKEYGSRLSGANLKLVGDGGSLERLIGEYPTHEFIIDSQEATEIFKEVRDPTPSELAVNELFGGVITYPKEGKALIIDVKQHLQEIVERSSPGPSTESSPSPGNEVDRIQGDRPDDGKPDE